MTDAPFGGGPFGEGPFGPGPEEATLQTLSPALYTDADTFYSAIVSLTRIYPALYTDADAFYAPSILRSAVTLTVPLFTDPDTFYGLSIYKLVSLPPDGDVVDGAWVNEVDSNVNLYASIDEATASDSDYIRSEDLPTNSIVRLRITNPATTLVEPFRVHYRYYKVETGVSGAMELKARLFDGATQIVEWTHSNIDSTPLTVTQTLSPAEFAAITDFSNLEVEFEATYV
jgi:hypothetical protein